MITVNCTYCGSPLLRKPYRVRNAKRWFCNRQCQDAWVSKNRRGESHHLYSRKKLKCDWCEKDFHRVPCYIKEDKNFCSHACANRWRAKNLPSPNIGRKISRETRDKISKSHFGITPSAEVREKMSLAKKGKTGDQAPRWKGALSGNEKIRKSIEYRLWREAVFARDNWTCKKCQKRGVSLHAHHIKSFSKYPELRLAIDNGITHCKVCHGKEHGRVIP